MGAPAVREGRAARSAPRTSTLLEQSGRLHLLEGPTELYPGIELFVSEGHTVGLQLVRVTDGDRSLVFCGDLIPTTSHLRPRG